MYLSLHSNLEAVTEIDVNDPPRNAIHKQVARMAVSQSENVSDHRHDGKRTAVVASTVEPRFRIARLEPHYAVKVLTGRIVEGVLEDFELLDLHEVVEVGSHLQQTNESVSMREKERERKDEPEESSDARY
jgi:hypothetical protein